MNTPQPPSAFSLAVLDRVSPFHVVFGRDLKIQALGPSLTRCCPGLRPGDALDAGFEIAHPPGGLRFEDIRRASRSFASLRYRQTGLVLRGEVLVDEASGVGIFAGAPVALRPADLATHGLVLSDFAGADALPDYLLLAQMEETLLRDGSRLARELERSRHELSEANLGLTERVRQQERLLAVGEVLQGVIDETEGLRRVCREIALLVAADTVGAWVVNAARTECTAVAGYHMPAGMRETVTVRLDELPFRDALFERGDVVSTDDAGGDSRFRLAAFKAAPHQSCALVPIFGEGAVIGAYHLIWWRARRLVTPKEQPLLLAMGRQSGMLLRSARLLARFRLLGELTARVSSSLDLDAVLADVVRAAASVMGVDLACLWLVDAEGGRLRLHASSDAAALVDFPADSLSSSESGAGEVVRTGALVAIPDVFVEDSPVSSRDWWRQHGLSSFVGVPVGAGSEFIGVLTLLGRTEIALGEEGRMLLAAFTSQVSAAIRNARLYRQSQEQARRLETLVSVAQRLTRALTLAEVLDAVVPAAAAVFGGEAGVRLLEGNELVRMRATPGARRAMARDRIPLGVSLSGQVAERGEPVVTEDTATDARLVPDHRASIEAASTGALMCVPMRLGARVLGTLNIYRERGHRFDEGAVHVAQALADQAAIALDNARLYEGSEARAWRLRALAGLSQSVSASLEVHTVLDAVVRAAAELTHAPAVALWTAGADGRELSLGAFQGAEDIERPPVDRVVVGEGVAGWVAANRMPREVPDVPGAPSGAPAWQDWSRLNGLPSLLALPVLLHDELLGVLALHGRAAFGLDADQRYMLEIFTGHAALAIRNASLYAHAEEARQAAEQAAKVKDDFLATMSHELRTPLNAILGLSEALEEQALGPLSAEQQKATHTVRSSGEHLLALINDILSLARVASGHAQLDTEPLDASRVVDAAVEMVAPVATAKRIEIEVACASGTVIANERRLKQVFVNLLGNAVKFTPEGGRVGVRVERDPDPSWLRFTVWDRGIGIPLADQGRLFQPFQQLDSELHRRYPGVGLGLALSRRLVEIHGGTIALESRAGEGTQVIVRLPQTTEVVPAAVASGPAPSDQPAARARDSSRGTILMAEDNEANVDTFEPYLSAHGYRVVVARDGNEVLPAIRRLGPDVVLMDIQLPGVDGLTLIRNLRTDPRFRATPIIALTAFGLPGDDERCLSAGADRYLAKPVRLKTLMGTIDELLRARRP